MDRELLRRSAFEAERRELEAVLSSGMLDPNSNPGKLLRYVCEKHFAGFDGEIKEYSLALDVFGRDSGFDNRRNSIVRVEASRLRKRLDEYYRREGGNHPLRIVIPPGQYVPQFVAQGEAHESRANRALPTAAEAPEHDGPDKRRISVLSRGRAVAGVAVLVFSIALLVLAPAPDRPTTAETALPASPLGVDPTLPGAPSEVRILAGYDRETHVDRAGNVWLGDRYFTGGQAIPVRPAFIARTLDSMLFQNMRSGSEFAYDIPLKPGNYELRLHFAETVFGAGLVGGGGEASRLMIVRANGKRLLYSFDVYAAAGGSHIADVRVFKDITPAEDGYLHLEFAANWDRPFLNALEILPSTPGKIRPIRIVARDTAVTDRAGEIWYPDNFSSGGRLALRKEVVTGTADPDLYAGERFGRFSYAIPVAPGKYRVTLHFAEGWFKGNAGERVFDVWCNGRTLLQDFDIARQAGGPQRAAQRTFRDIQPTSYGKIELSFVPVVNYACVNAIEVIDESN